MNALVAIAALLGLALVAGGGGGSLPPGTAINKKGFQEIRQLSARAGLGQDYTNFLIFVAYGESKGNNLVGLGNPALYPPWTRTHQKWLDDGQPALSNAQRKEARAATSGYNRSAYLHGCWPKSGYVFGSGGWFGFLPSSALKGYKDTALQCQHPFTIFDPVNSVVMALKFIRGLQGWKAWRDGPQTVLALRAGWGLPSKMDDTAHLASKRAKYEKHLDALGIPRSFLDRRLNRLNNFDPVAVVQLLGGVIWLPGGSDA